MVERVRQLAPDGSPDNVVTTVDFSAAEHGVRATGGADKRAWQALCQAGRLYEAGLFSMHVEQAFPLDEQASRLGARVSVARG